MDHRQALDAFVKPVYGRFGYKTGGVVEKRLLDDLSLPAEGRHSSAESFRNTLWSAWSGGGVSADVTKQVFKALGRKSEVINKNWI